MKASRTPVRSLLLLSLGLLALPTAAADTAAQRHLREVESWRQERLENLRQPDGWLTLVGLAWLQEGSNTCGSDPESDVVLPKSTPPRVGVFELADEKVEFAAAPGSGVRHEGKAVERLELVSDAAGEPTALELGSVKFYVIRRGDRFGVRIKDSHSPTYLGFHGLDYFPVSFEWRLDARFVPHDPPKKVEIPTVLGTVDEDLSPGDVVFETGGETYRLEAFQGGDDGELFLVFGDETNGAETYGGGRFLYTPKPEDGHVVVDFNEAYSPPCVFTPFATCPLPPPQNRLPIPVPAGEKKYGEGHH